MDNTLVNFIVTIVKEDGSSRVVDCKLREDVWDVIGTVTEDEIYNVDSPTFECVLEFIPF